MDFTTLLHARKAKVQKITFVRINKFETHLKNNQSKNSEFNCPHLVTLVLLQI